VRLTSKKAVNRIGGTQMMWTATLTWTDHCVSLHVKMGSLWLDIRDCGDTLHTVFASVQAEQALRRDVQIGAASPD
jgi:hypothetical protein